MTFGCFAGLTGFDCSMAWIVMILLFFLGAVLRRQIGDALGFEFSLIGATVGAELIFIISLYITNSLKWGFILGLLGLIIGGFVAPIWLGDGGGDGGGGWF